jgi:uncharacterized protein with von Willebrand factor type A (vWA) domain
LLRALRANPRGAPILLIDEIDRADEAFEAYLLELLSDWQISIPELGTIAAATPPIVIITSNRTREIHDALKRRCFYHWVDYPSREVEREILALKAPEAGAVLQAQVVDFVQTLRGQQLFKSPGVAETIDWAQALVELNCVALDPQTVDSTMGVLLKYQDDISPYSRKRSGAYPIGSPSGIGSGRAVARMIETVPTRISHPTPKLDQNIMLFVRLLRAIGLKLGSASMLEAIDAAKTVGVADKDFLYHALVSCLIKRREDKPLFDQAFYLFWQNPKFHERIRDLILPRIKAAGHQQEDVEPMLRRLSDALADPPDDPPNTAEDVEIDFDTEGTAADTDRLQHKDFEMMSAAEIRHAEQAIANLQPKLPRRSARRSKLSSRGQLIAMRAALQHAERQGGMVIPKFRSVITKPRPLVILCDISGSMEHYSRIMLHFIHALTRNHPQVSSFLFGTRLTNISRQMRHRDVDEAVQSVSHLVDDWSGGTRISASLETFNQMVTPRYGAGCDNPIDH